MMKMQENIFDDDFSSSKFDIIIEWILISLLAFMPFAFGVVHAWSEQVVIVLSGAILICFLLKLVFGRKKSLIWTWAYVPLALFLMLVVIQLIALPREVVGIISPNTSQLKTELLNDLPDPDNFLKTMTLSFYSCATKHDLRILLALAGVFFVVLNEFRRPEKIRHLLSAIIIIGTIIAVLALAQNLFGNGKIYWFINSRNSDSYSGPFVNHSHYGQFMNLTIGAAFALLSIKLSELFDKRKISLLDIFDFLSSRASISIWLLIVMIGISMATIFISLTRGGIISMLIAMCFLTLVVSSKYSLKSHGWIMVVTALVAFICVLYIGFDAVFDRMATLRNLNKEGQSRMQMFKDTAAAWSKFPLFGTGLGTYSVVYPMFDNTNMTALATHAENEYAQAAEETGLTGLGLLVFFAIIIGLSFIRSIRKINYPVQAAAYGLGFGLIAILIHSFSDFGQHLPANAFLSSIFCALLITLAKYNKDGHLNLLKVIPCKSMFSRILLLLFACGIFAWSFDGANRKRLADKQLSEAFAIESELIKTKWLAGDNVYSELLNHAGLAVSYEPDNVNNLYLLNVYHWRKINRTNAPSVSSDIVKNDTIIFAKEINNNLDAARKLCSTYGPVYTLSGQIEKYILGQDKGSDKIKKGFMLAPCDPVACFIAGYLDICEGRFEDCFAKLDKAVELNASFFGDVVKIYTDDLSRPDKAIEISGDIPSRLLYLVSYFTESRYEDLAQECRMKVKNILEKKCVSSGSASDNVSLAQIYKQLNEKKSAIEYYHRALALDYGQVSWRIELAKLLADSGDIPEAMNQVKICLRIKPNFKEAEKLLADLSLSPAGWSMEVKSR